MLLAEIKSDADKFSEVISKTLDVDVLIVDNNLKTVSNTCRYFDKFTLISRTSIVGRVILSGETVAIDDRTTFAACKNCPEFYECEMAGIIGVPIFYNEVVVGAIALVLPKQKVPVIFKDVRNSIAFVENMSALLTSKIRNRDDYNTLNIARREREVLMDSIADAIVSTDDLGRIAYYNRQFPKYFDIREDCCGEMISQVIPHKVILDFLTNSVDVRDKMVYMGETGQLFCGFVSCSNISINGNRNGMLFLFRPVSSANQDLEELSAQHPAASFAQTAGHVFSGELVRRAKRLAMTEESILIQGEEGTGKRLLAQCIHEFSNRSQMPMVSVDCGWPYHAGQEEFLFGELGRLQAAHKSTLFFHHVERLPLYLQKQLAAFLQTRTLRHKSGFEVFLDIRMLFSTAEDPEKMVSKGQLWDKLYYGISCAALTVPPLRADSVRLRQLLEERACLYGERYGKPGLQIHEQAMESLLHYQWPNNLREAELVIDRLAAVCDGEIRQSDVAELKLKRQNDESYRQPLSELEREHIRHLLQTNQNKDEIARILKIGRATLYRKIKEYDL